MRIFVTWVGFSAEWGSRAEVAFFAKSFAVMRNWRTLGGLSPNAALAI
jgi:hypothetical protein